MKLNIIRRPFRYVFFNAVYWIIGINVLVFAFMYFFGDTILFHLKLGLYEYPITFEQAMPMRPDMIVNFGWVWGFFTYMFMHGSISHLIFNMLGLFVFGIHVERRLGSKEFLLYYFVTGILAGILSFCIYYFTGNQRIALVGASGALFAVMLAFAVYFPNYIVHIWGIIPLRAPVMVLGYTALELIFTISGGRGNVAHMTHLAGFIFGWLYLVIRCGINPWRYLRGR